MPAIEILRDTLSNGVSVISNPNRLTESIAIAGSIKAGTMRDPLGGFGTAELVSRMLTRGTRKRSAAEISRTIEEMGATLEFSNYDESVSFSARCHADYLGQLLEILSDCVCNPTFGEEETEKTKAEIISDLEAERDETRRMAYRGLLGELYGKDGTYGRDTLGAIEDVVRLRPDNARRFHGDFYDPQSMILAVTGRFDHSDLLSKVEDSLASWAKMPKVDTSLPRPLDSFPPSSVTFPMPHKSQVDVGLGARTVPRKSEEYHALNLGNLILGRIGLYGRLGRNVRDEKGLAYYCFSTLQSKLFAGHVAILAGVNPKNLEKAIEGIAEEIQRISSEPLSASEITKGRKNLLGSLSLSLESSIERVSLLHDIEYFSLGADYLERYGSILESVTPESVLRSFERYFTLDKVSLAVAGPVKGESSKTNKIKLPKEISFPHAE